MYDALVFPQYPDKELIGVAVAQKSLAIGFAPQVTGVKQEISADQPLRFVNPSEAKTNVKHVPEEMKIGMRELLEIHTVEELWFLNEKVNLHHESDIDTLIEEKLKGKNQTIKIPII